MQQRRVRLGDIVDDYCPRERRVTNHAVVALIEDKVKQTRCTTCDADHEYKQAKVPAQRRRKAVGVLEKEQQENPGRPRPMAPPVEPVVDAPVEESPAEYVEAAALDEVALEIVDSSEGSSPLDEATEAPVLAAPEDEWPVHRRLIRATLPRPEGQVPERKAPDFTIQPNSGRFDGNRGGARPRGQRPGRPHGFGHSQGQRMTGQRQGGGQGVGEGQRHGNRQGQPDGQRGGGHAHGQHRGHQQGSGSGRRRGR